MRRRLPSRLALAALAALATLAAAVPASRAGDARDALPGVTGGHAIVGTVPPEPEPEKRDGRGTSFRVGDWDVTISGSVSVEIGKGRMPSGGRDDRD